MADWTHDDARNGYSRMLERAAEEDRQNAETDRRLARYDEAIRLLTKLESKVGGDLETALFLADERKVAG